MAKKYKEYKLYSPQGKRLLVVKARKMKSAMWKKPGPGFKPICSLGVIHREL